MPVRVSCISAQTEDGELLRALREHTAGLQRSGDLVLHDRTTALAGSRTDDEGPLAQAQVVLALVTRHFLADDDAWRQVSAALRRGRRQRVVLLRVLPSDIESSGLGGVEALPRDGSWIGSADNDKAWYSVCQELKKLLAEVPTEAGGSSAGAIAVLPPPPRCIGRDDDRRTLVAQLLDPAPSIVLGGAGLGKTTLLVSALHDPAVAAAYGGRRYFVRCDSATRRDDVVLEIARVLGVPLNPQLEHSVLARLSEAPTLLALDNAETPWEADRDAVEDLLLLLSSAAKLVLTLRGAERPARVHFQPPLKPQPLILNDARQIFLDIAGDKRAQDPLLDPLIAAVDRLPLALTLLAHRAEPDPDLSTIWSEWNELGPAAASRDQNPAHAQPHVEHPGGSGAAAAASHNQDRLNNLALSLELSVHGPRMRACPAAARLLALLGFLPDGVAWDDLETLLPGASREAARTLRRVGLASDENSMLRVLAPVREHARRRCPLSKEDLARALALYLTRAAELGRRIGFDGSGAAASARLAAEAGNSEAAIERALAQHRYRKAVEALWGFGNFARFSGYQGRVVDLLNDAAVQSPAVRDRALCLYSIGDIAFARSDHAAARARFDAALPLFQQVGDLKGQASCIMSLGYIALRRSDHAAARAHFDAALPLFQQLGSLHGQANCIRSLGDLALRRADYAEARARFDASLPLFQQVGSLLGQAECTSGLGILALYRADYAQARAHFEAALPLFLQVGDIQGQANCIRSLGDIAIRSSDHAEARARFGAALPLFKQVGSLLGQAHCIKSLGNIALQSADPAEAHARFDAALALFRQVGELLGEANCLFSLGEIALRRSDHAEARARFDAALALYQRISAPYSIGRTQIQRAHLSENPQERRAHAAAAFAAWRSIDREDLVQHRAAEFPDAV